MTREEAIKVVRKNMPSDKSLPVYEALETLIPELAESEYEKTRRELISQVEKSRHHPADKARWISWLEKQKEQKHPNGCFTCDEYKKGYEEGRRNGFTAGYNKAMKEVEQKEQKPELPLMGGDTDTYFDDLRITTKSLTSREWFNEGIKYAQRLQKEQKPSSQFRSGDWVVYDGPLGHAILQVKDVVAGRYSFVDNVSTLLVEDSDKFLRALTPKDVEKPAEWSEEDEERLINTSISFLKDFADKGYENAVECIDWLKSKLNGNTCE